MYRIRKRCFELCTVHHCAECNVILYISFHHRRHLLNSNFSVEMKPFHHIKWSSGGQMWTNLFKNHQFHCWWLNGKTKAVQSLQSISYNKIRSVMRSCEVIHTANETTTTTTTKMPSLFLHTICHRSPNFSLRIIITWLCSFSQCCCCLLAECVFWWWWWWYISWTCVLNVSVRVSIRSRLIC